jgi:DNA (cytosine-5)-methyltransferase 1
MLRVISEAQPTWIIGENVGGFINMGLDDCISDLETEGYEVQPLIIPACAVNAPHRRDRVWIVAYSKSRETLTAEQRGLHPESGGEDRSVKHGKDNAAIDVVSHADANRFNGNDAGHGAGEISQQQKAEIFRGEFNTDTGNERLQGCQRHPPHEQGQAAHESITECNNAWHEPWLEAATRLCRVDDGLPRQVDRVDRLKALGNAIVPQVAAEIMRAILNAS